MNKTADVSIIVPTRNEARNLPRLMMSIAAQVGVVCEVIVVDQESDDSTARIAAEFEAKLINREQPQFYSPPSTSRNIGAKEAQANVLLHLDADMQLPDPEFMHRFLALFDDLHQAVIIHETDVAVGWWNQVKGVERACYWDTSLECARGVTKSLFGEIGGYDEAISSGEDMYIQQMYLQHTNVAREAGVFLFHHTGRIPLKRLLAKKFSYGRTAKSYLSASAAVDGHSATSWVRESLKAYFTHANVARKNPLQFVCIFPLRFMELVAVQLGMHKVNRT